MGPHFVDAREHVWLTKLWAKKRQKRSVELQSWWFSVGLSHRDANSQGIIGLYRKNNDKQVLLTLEEESARLLSGGCRHCEPHRGVGPHGLRPQFRLHLSVERRHGRLDSYREIKKNHYRSLLFSLIRIQVCLEQTIHIIWNTVSTERCWRLKSQRWTFQNLDE